MSAIKLILKIINKGQKHFIKKLSKKYHVNVDKIANGLFMGYLVEEVFTKNYLYEKQLKMY